MPIAFFSSNILYHTPKSVFDWYQDKLTHRIISLHAISHNPNPCTQLGVGCEWPSGLPYCTLLWPICDTYSWCQSVLRRMSSDGIVCPLANRCTWRKVSQDSEVLGKTKPRSTLWSNSLVFDIYSAATARVARCHVYAILYTKYCIYVYSWPLTNGNYVFVRSQQSTVVISSEKN